MLSAHVTASNNADSDESLGCTPLPPAHSGDAPAAHATRNDSNIKQHACNQADDAQHCAATAVRRRGPGYALTIGDHFALMTSSALLVASLYFYFYVDVYGSGDWHYHMTQRPPTPQAADEELFLVAMEYQISEHKKKGLMPEDPRGDCNVTVTPGTSELDSFKFRVLQDIRRKAEAPGPTEQKIAKAHRMAMEAAESAYLEQLAADAKADAAYGYVEPWSMPRSVDEFAGKEQEDGDGGLYGEWNDHDDSRGEEEHNTANGKHLHASSGSALHDVIHAQPAAGYQDDDGDSDDFYGDGGVEQGSVPPPRQRARDDESFAGRSREDARAANAADKRHGAADKRHGAADKRHVAHVETLVHVASDSKRKPQIMLSMEGSRDTPALVYETRGFDPASGHVEIIVGGEKVMQTQQPDGEISINTEGRESWTIDASARILDGKGLTVATTRKVFTQADAQ